MNRERMEQIVRIAGMKPERRERHGDYEIFVADGFSLPPHSKFKRFGIEPEEFPHGMYATLWFVAKDENLDAGGVFFCEAMHDKNLDMATKKQARVNTAIKEASGFLIRRKKNH
jgi:hypothetical protein